jgi:hypothetical protein
MVVKLERFIYAKGYVICMARQLGLYMRCMNILLKLQIGRELPDALKEMRSRGYDTSGYADEIAAIAERANHFVYDAYPPNARFEPDVTFLLHVHGDFCQIPRQEREIADMIKNALANQLITEKDTILLEGTKGELLYDRCAQIPGFFMHGIESDGKKGLIAVAQGRFLELCFDELGRRKMPVFFCDSKKLVDKVNKYSQQIIYFDRLSRKDARYETFFERSVDITMDTMVERARGHFLPAIVEHAKHGRVLQVFGMHDYNIQIIPEALKEQGISYMAIAPKSVI